MQKDMRSLFAVADTSDVRDLVIPRCMKVRLDNLSDGGAYLLNLYSTIETCLKQNKAAQEEYGFAGYERIVLLLDEQEQFMHPEWARRIFNELIIFLDKLSNVTGGAKFQLIITTHSPFMLSDVPSEQVIPLNTDTEGFCIVEKKRIEGMQTFGANIYTLLKHSFFMESGMGEFARTTVDSIIQRIKPIERNHERSYPKINQDEYEALKGKIGLIGDEVLRRKLLSMLNECCGSVERLSILNEEKNRIEAQIEALKKEMDQ